MTTMPVAEGLFAGTGADAHLLGTRCDDCAMVTFPSQDSCPRCASMEMREHALARRGTLWAWTTQSFPPPSPPYNGPTGKDFVPFNVGYVAVGDEVKVESRIVEIEPADLRIGMELELTIIPFRVDADGNDVVTFAFRPIV